MSHMPRHLFFSLRHGLLFLCFMPPHIHISRWYSMNVLCYSLTTNFSSCCMVESAFTATLTALNIFLLDFVRDLNPCMARLALSFPAVLDGCRPLLRTPGLFDPCDGILCSPIPFQFRNDRLTSRLPWIPQFVCRGDEGDGRIRPPTILTAQPRRGGLRAGEG